MRKQIRFNKIKLGIIIAASIISFLSITAGILSVVTFFKRSDVKEFHYEYPTYAKVGIAAEVLGQTNRVKPVSQMSNGGLNYYPQYGKTLALSAEDKAAIINENGWLCGRQTKNVSGQYDWMDANGNLYKGTRSNYTALNRQLYQHTASVGMYLGNVSENETAVVKRLAIRPRPYTGYYEVTGLYAPAGEVIKIELTSADMNATNGITIHIGQGLFNGQANNIWDKREFNRMPVILNTLLVNKDTAVFDAEKNTWTAYVGSYLGGPIYIRDNRKSYTVTISGGVNYPHFILGKTTPDDLAELRKSSAPYFDMEIWETGILLSGPRTYTDKFTYEQLFQAAELWQKISLVTNSVKGKNHGVVFLFDPFVAAGAAVAFPGRWSVNCPLGWFANCLNYNSFVASGNWGNLHEYHHNYQNFGVGSTGEVTNNALNLISYSLFTNISAARQIGGFGGSGLSGWNTYTSATWVQNQINNGAITSTNGLSVYAALIHNLGQDAFIKTTGFSGAGYFNKWAEVTHQDFSDFVDTVSGYAGSLSLTANNYPLFVPVSCVYQTGRSYMFDDEKRYIQTMQPFTIPYGKPFNIDLNPYLVNETNQYKSGSIVLPAKFSYRVKKISTGNINGNIKDLGGNIYQFTPNEILRSGKMYVTIEILYNGKPEYNGKKINDVDLVLEFQQTHEMNKFILERTVYTYEVEQNGKDARQLYQNNYAGYQSKTEIDSSNPVQNSNTDIWLYPRTEQNLNDSNKAKFVVDARQVMEVRGKLYFPDIGKYRIYLRGRGSCALYLSTDNDKTYTEAAYIDKTINTTNTAEFLTNNAATYHDVEIKQAQTWIYFKEILVTGGNNFIGLGIGAWSIPDADVPEDKKASEIKVAEATPPTGKPSYVTAYRSSYAVTPQFRSEYFYYPQYTLKIGEQSFKHVAPDDNMLSYYGEWQIKNEDTNFGHLYVGDCTSRIEFDFYGEQFALLSNKKFSHGFQVYVDDIILPAAIIENYDNIATITYLSLKLTQRYHHVVITGIDEFNFESLAFI